jgi:hypothetical protein
MEIYASGDFLVRDLIPCALWLGFWVFSPGVPAVFLREGYARYVIPCRVLAVVQMTSFLPSVRELDSQLFDGGVVTLLQFQ